MKQTGVFGRVVLGVFLLTLLAGGSAFGLPDIEIDTNEEIIYIPQGTVSSNLFSILNLGDEPLTWEWTERVEGTVLRSFDNPWTSARSMRYDATRDCLWLSYYGSTDIKKVDPVTGLVLETKTLPGAPYAIEVDDGGDLWMPLYASNCFYKVDLDSMAIVDETPFPTGWDRCMGLARGDGQMFATRYDSSHRDELYRLNSSSGAVEQTFDSGNFFWYTANHVSYGYSNIWSGIYFAPRNGITRFDPSMGRIRSVIDMPDWYEQMNIYDQSFAGTNRQMWVMTYRHDYHTSGSYERTIHLIDPGPWDRVSPSAYSGTVAADGAEDLQVVFDARDMETGHYRMTAVVDSNGGATQEKPYLFVVHGPGANTPPTADAGPDQALDAIGPTTAVTLDGSGSSDADGDVLVYRWTEITPTGEVTWATTESATVDLPPGVHDITLTVDDYRGAPDSDTVRITVSAPNIEVEDVYVPYPVGGGVVTGTVTIVNTGDRALNWSVGEIVTLPSNAVIREFEVTWVSSSNPSYGFPYSMTYDATRDSLWVSYYYDDEVGRLSATDGTEIETKTLGSGHKAYKLEMQDANLWVADYSAQSFKKFDMAGTPSLLSTTPKPGDWAYGPAAVSWYAAGNRLVGAEHYETNLYELVAGSGAIQSTFPTVDKFYYSGNGIDVEGSTLWYSVSTEPFNRLCSLDMQTGSAGNTILVDGWDGVAGRIADVSSVSSTQCWALTSNVKGDSKRWAHLLDLSDADGLDKSLSSGTVPAGGTNTMEVTLDTAGLEIGWHTFTLCFGSDDPDDPVVEREMTFIIHEDAPNTAPVADAGPDEVRDIPGVSAPFLPDLSGSGSIDPDGDTLFMSWTLNGEPVELTDKGLIELGAGTHVFELTVDDLRGGVDSDSFTFTVNTNVVPEGSPQYMGPTRNGVYPMADGWLENWPPIERWRTYVGKGYGGVVISDGRVYSHSDQATWCLDLSDGRVLWSKTDKRWGDDPGEEYCAPGAEWPAVDETQVYVYESDSTAMAYNKVTGELAWAVPTHTLGNSSADCGRGASPLVEGDLVFFGRVALNKKTGEFVYATGGWSAHGAGSAFDYNGRRWLCRDGSAYDILTGYTAPFGSVGAYSGRGRMTPVWYGDRFYSATGVRLIGASDYLWRDYNSTYGTQYQMPVAFEGYGYTTRSGQYRSPGGELLCVRLADGALMWTGPTAPQISIAGDKLIKGTTIAKTGPDGYDTEGRAKFLLEGTKANGYHNATVPLGQRLYIRAENWVVCLDCAYSAPVLGNRLGSWDQRASQATLRGTLVNTGGRTPVNGYIYWGRADGGTNALQWEHCVSLGTLSTGAFETVVSDVPSDSVIYYRCYAQNAEGGAWAAGPAMQLSTFQTRVEGESGLVLHWPLNESSGFTAADVSGCYQHGELNQGHRKKFQGDEWTEGVAGNGLHFPQTGCGLRVPAPFSEPLCDSWTIAFWVRPEPSVGGTVLRLRQGEEDTGNDPQSAELEVSWDSGRLALNGTKTQPINDGEWHHAVLLRDGGRYRLYLDGVMEFERAVADNEPRYCLMFFGMAGGNAAYANGMNACTLDDVRVYLRTLSVLEIKALMNLAAGTDTFVPATVTASADDAEEAWDGTVTLGGTNLNLGTDPGANATVVGLRFPGLAIPRGATIASAHLQFGAGATHSNLATLAVRGEAADSAAAFSSSPNDLSARAVTEAGAAWLPPAWETGQGGAQQLSPNLGSIVQEIVDRPGWTSGGAIALLIQGDGRRVADAFDRVDGTAPALTVQWSDAEDLDEDGLPDDWERASLSAEPTAVLPDEDHDGDGITASGEYAAGTGADDPGSALELYIRSLTNGGVAVGFYGRVPEGIGYDYMDRFYTLDHCARLVDPETGDPMAWKAVPALSNLWVRSSGEILLTNSVPDALGFYRLRALLSAHLPPVADAGADQLVYDEDLNGFENITLDGSGSTTAYTEPLTYSWSTGGVEIATGAGPVVSLPVGTHAVTLVVDDGLGATASDVVLIEIDEPRVAVPGEMQIRFSGYEGSSTLSQFPVLVVFSNGMANGFSYDDFASPDGHDLRFTASNGVTELNYEVESWNPDGASYVWVQVPELASTGSYIYASWGVEANTNPPACTTNGSTWANGYVAVWHMSETGAGDRLDSTVNGYHAMPVGYDGDEGVAGLAGGAQELNGVDDYLSIRDLHYSTVGEVNELTVSAWAKSSSQNDQIIASFDRNEVWRLALHGDRDGGNAGWDTADSSGSNTDDLGTPQAYTDGGWHMISGWFKASTGTDKGIVADGQSVVTAAAHGGLNLVGAADGPPKYGFIGVGSEAEVFNGEIGPPDYLMGAVDEVRISSVARSIDWLRAEYQTMADHAAFTTYGDVVNP